MLIGLTGTYCAGKNYVASLLEARGLPVLDVDKLGYQVLETEKEAIFAQFGYDLRVSGGENDGTLDRRLLGKKVFGQPEKLKALEGIVHPAVNRLTEDWIQRNTAAGKHSVINAALLHRCTAFSRLDCIILVAAPIFVRLLRAKRRDKLPWRAVFKRFASQKNFRSQYLSSNAEIYKVENPAFCGKGNLRRLESRIEAVLQSIKL